MKIINKFIFLVSVLFIMLFDGVVTAATAPDEVYVVNEHQIGSQQYFGTYVKDSSYKALEDGKVVYCADYDKNPPMLNHPFSYTKKNVVSDDRVAYVLANGYPNNSMTGNNDKDYYITAMSLWYFLKPDADIWSGFDFDAGTYNGSSNVVVSEMAKLIKGAENYKGPSIKVSLIKDNANSVGASSYVTVEGVATMSGLTGTYTVSVTGASSGTYVTDMSGNKTSSFSSGTHFLINVPVSEVESLYDGINVSVKAGGDVSKAYLYYATNYDYYQDVVTLYTDYVEVSDSDSYSIDKPEEPELTKVKISKRDATTGEELPGATLTLKDSNGNVVETWVSTDEVHIIEGLDAGTYTLTETIAPDGYIASTESVTVVIKDDGSVTEVIMLNTPTVVKISKVDIATSEELPGATLTIKDENGKVVETWVSTKDVHVIKGLVPGKYTLTEEIAPEGYELMETVIEFTIGNDGKVSVKNTVVKDNLIVFENSPLPEQVDTGNVAFYVVIITGMVALATTVFLVLTRDKKFSV